jgi:hypothetical protein
MDGMGWVSGVSNSNKQAKAAWFSLSIRELMEEREKERKKGSSRRSEVKCRLKEGLVRPVSK